MRREVLDETIDEMETTKFQINNFIRVRATGFEKGFRMTWREYCSNSHGGIELSTLKNHNMSVMPNKIKIYRGW